MAKNIKFNILYDDKEMGSFPENPNSRWGGKGGRGEDMEFSGVSNK